MIYGAEFYKWLKIFNVQTGPSANPLTYLGTWNANTNTPTLVSSVGVAQTFYIVSVAGTTNLNGHNDWHVGDWAIFNGAVWTQVPNLDNFVVGPTSATDNALCRYNGTSGSLIQNSAATLDDSGNMATAGLTLSTTPLNAASGGSGRSSPTAHAVLIAAGASAFNLIALTDGQILIGSTGADPVAGIPLDGTNIGWTTGAGTLTANLSGVVSPTLGGTGLAYTSTYNTSITPFIVGPSGKAGYNTIQSALDALITAGGGAIYAQAGTYTEDLDASAASGIGISIIGVTPLDTLVNDAFGDITIIGIHTPPNDGFFTFSDLILQSATDIINTSAAGTGALSLLDCSIRVTDGYTFNVTNWAGSIYVNTCGDESTNNGFINNATGTAFVAVHDSHVGSFGSTNIMTVGSCSLVRSDIRCPMSTKGSYTAYYNTYNKSVTFNDGCNAEMYYNTMTRFGEAVIHNNSSGGGGHIFMGNIVNCSHNPAIDGTGTDAFIEGGNTWFSNSNISGSFTVIRRPTVVTSGGTGISSATAYGTIIAGTTDTSPFQVVDPGTSGYVLTSNGAAAAPTFQVNANGNVVGPASATDNAICRFDGTTGKLIKNSSVFVDASNNLNVERSETGQAVVSQVSNTSNTNGSNAIFSAKVAAGGGDPFTLYSVVGGVSFAQGIDVSNSSNYKLSLNSSLGTNDIYTVDSATGITNFGFSNLGVSRIAIGSAVVVAVTNNAHSGASDARFVATVQSGSAGNPFSLYTIGGGNSWAAGAETASGAYKISLGGVLGTGDAFVVNDTGLIQIPLGDLNVSRNNSGSPVVIEVINSANTVGSHAVMQCWVNGAGAGDAYTQYTVNGVTNVVSGIDNSDSQAYKISLGIALGTGDAFKITTAGVVGQVTLPQQVSFMAYNSAPDANVTGDGTLYTVIFNQYTQVGTSYNNSTGVFTAPVDGWYLFDVAVVINNISVSHTSAFIDLLAGGNAYRGSSFNPGVVKTVNNDCTLLVSRKVYLTAGQTAQIQIAVSGGTATVGVDGDTVPDLITSFSGGLSN